METWFVDAGSKFVSAHESLIHSFRKGKLCAWKLWEGEDDPQARDFRTVTVHYVCVKNLNPDDSASFADAVDERGFIRTPWPDNGRVSTTPWEPDPRKQDKLLRAIKAYDTQK